MLVLDQSINQSESLESLESEESEELGSSLEVPALALDCRRSALPFFAFFFSFPSAIDCTTGCDREGAVWVEDHMGSWHSRVYSTAHALTP
jgi:hypothetical protein